MNPARILVVDDEAVSRENLCYILSKEGHETLSAENGFKALKAAESQEFDLVLTDLKMEIMDGIKLLESIKEKSPATEVIIVTGFGTVASAVEAMRKGAYHYLVKPFNLNEVRMVVSNALEKRFLRQEIQSLRKHLEDRKKIPFMIGNSAKMVELQAMMEQIAPSDCSVLIQGETGTGKELVAKAIHQMSPRAANRFMAFNCGAFNEELLANELFGHEKEAFTGAQKQRPGLLETASGGTVFLDEIGEMPLPMQIKLLRALQERKIMRVGGTSEISIDIRVLAATNKDLKHEIAQGRFRSDLYYRLNVICLSLPLLCERKADIPLLCLHFLKKFSFSRPRPVDEISEEAMEILMDYDYPGNVRELENIIERAVTLAKGPRIETAHLPPDLQSLRIHRRPSSELMSLAEKEKEYILWVLKKVAGSRTRAAEILGIDRASLWRKIKKYQAEESVSDQ